MIATRSTQFRSARMQEQKSGCVSVDCGHCRQIQGGNRDTLVVYVVLPMDYATTEK